VRLIHLVSENVVAEQAQVNLEHAVEALDSLLAYQTKMLDTRGMSRELAMEAIAVMPNFLGKYKLETFTPDPSIVHYDYSVETVAETVKATLSKVWEKLKELIQKLINWIKSVSMSHDEKKQKQLEKIRAAFESESPQVKNAFEKIIQRYESVYSGSSKATPEKVGLDKDVEKGVLYARHLEALMEKASAQFAENLKDFIDKNPWVKAMYLDPEFYTTRIPVDETIGTITGYMDLTSVSLWAEKIDIQSRTEKLMKEVESKQRKAFDGKTTPEFISDVKEKLEKIKHTDITVDNALAKTAEVCTVRRPALGDMYNTLAVAKLEHVKSMIDRKEKQGMDVRVAQRFISTEIANLYGLIRLATDRWYARDNLAYFVANFFYDVERNIFNMRRDLEDKHKINLHTVSDTVDREIGYDSIKSVLSKIR